MLENPLKEFLVKKAAGDYVPYTAKSLKDPYNLHWTQDVGNWFRDLSRHAQDYADESAPFGTFWGNRIPYFQSIGAVSAPINNILHGRGPFSNWSDKDAYTDKAERDKKQAVDALYDSSSSGWSDAAGDKWKWDYTTMLDPRFKSVKDIVSVLDSDPKYKAALETVAKTGNLDDLRGYYAESGKPNAVANIWNSKYNIGDNAQGNAQLALNLYNSAKLPKQVAPVATPAPAAPTATPAAAPAAATTVAPSANTSANVAPNVAPSASKETPAGADPTPDPDDLPYIDFDPASLHLTSNDVEIPTVDFTPSFMADSAPVAAPVSNPVKTPLGDIDMTGATNMEDAIFNRPYDADDTHSSIEADLSASNSVAAQGQQEAPEAAIEATPQSKTTTVKNPRVSIEQARELLAKGIAPTSIGGYHQTLGADGTNPQAQQELELMDKDPTYNPFANTQAKYVQKLNRMRLSDQYNPEVIRAENQRIQQNQAKLDADRRARMDGARYYAGQGNQGAIDYNNYMTRGGQLSQAGQQWRDNFDVAGWNKRQSQARQRQANKTRFRAQQPITNPVRTTAPLGVKPRSVGEQAAMSKALGNADTGTGAGSYAAANAYNAASNNANGLSNTASADKFPVSVTPPNNGTTLDYTTSEGTRIYKKPSVNNPFTNHK